MRPRATKEEREIATLRDMRSKEFAFLVAFDTFYNHKRTGRIQLGEQNGPSVPALVGDRITEMPRLMLHSDHLAIKQIHHSQS